MKQLDLQRFLFEKPASRLELLKYKPQTQGKAFKVLVYRNHSFELIEHTIGAYLDYAGVRAEFEYSDYDDSLSFINVDPQADLMIVWLDVSRYNALDPEKFINERLAHLKTRFQKPVLFVGVGRKAVVAKENAFTLDVSVVQAVLGDRFYDERMETLSGTRLSNTACLALSRELGLNYLPSLLLPNLKAVFVDLDNTLYGGVLGEDGIQNLKLTPGHIRLQNRLKALAEQGYFLCAVSKNEQPDAEKLFEERTDFPLQKSDFTKISASWNSKPQMMAELLSFLNINEDSVLFVDDNIGEVSAVQAAYPAMKLLLAGEKAELTAQILENYPRLNKLAVNREDALRAQDARANEERRKAQAALSPEEYIKNLQMELTLSFDDLARAPRVAELAGKTNQFIFSYKRYPLARVEEMMKDPAYCVLTLALKDKLSDSGIIGVLVLKKEAGFARLEECFVSCRALGRGIDRLMLFYALQQALERLGESRLQTDFTRGERNLPAYNFVQEYLQPFLNAPAPFSYAAPRGLVTFKFN